MVCIQRNFSSATLLSPTLSAVGHVSGECSILFGDSEGPVEHHYLGREGAVGEILCRD